ncbi:MAG: hypothetical protein LBD41_02780 [Clostridiales Family XIII bacterium]|jgi:hypothetical protein|nr:hypothetical protein [Clostridiales Family XIII bacterium]
MTDETSTLTILQAYLNDMIEFTNLMELFAFLSGIKSVIRFTGLPNELQNYASIVCRLNLFYKIPPIHLKTIYQNSIFDSFTEIVSGFPAKDEFGLLFVGSPEHIDRAIDLENSGCPAHEAALLYGYPKCCADNYEKNIQHDIFWLNSYFEKAPCIDSISWKINRIGRLFEPYLSILPDYFPCSVNCEKSLSLANEYCSLLEQRNLSPLIKIIREHLARPVLIHEGCIYWLHPLQDTFINREDKSFMVKILKTIAYDGSPISMDTLLLKRKNNYLIVNNSESGGKISASTKLLLFG